jgi:dihydropteroate synthase
MKPVLRICGRGSLTITLHGLTSGQAALLHDILRSSDKAGGGPALSRSADAYSPSLPVASADPILTGTPRELKHLARIIASHRGLPADLPKKIDSLLDNYVRSDYKIMCGGHLLDLGSRTHIMGILNVTPDSFSDGGQYVGAETALSHAREMAGAGADIIDIGGESTRPGAAPLPEEEELARIIPLIKRLSAELSVPLSVDTYKSRVAQKALEAGAKIVNDISGLRFSPDMAKIVADYGAAVVIMHIKGTPRDMQQNPVYKDVVGEVMSYLGEGIELAEKAGVDREKIFIDPGIGFGKTLEHNLTLLNRLDEFRGLGRPIVLGTSRKKFIGAALNIPVPEQRVDGTAATVTIGIERGASVVRVHDVARMAQVARMTDAILKSAQSS